MPSDRHAAALLEIALPFCRAQTVEINFDQAVDRVELRVRSKGQKTRAARLAKLCILLVEHRYRCAKTGQPAPQNLECAVGLLTVKSGAALADQ